MNRYKTTLLILLAAPIFQNALAADRQPDSNGDANHLYTSDFISIDPSTGLGTLEIRLDNTTDNFNSYQMDLYLGDGFEISKTARGAYEVKANNGDEDTSKTVDHVVSVSALTGFYRIVCYSPTMQYIFPGDDLLLTVTVKAPENYDYNNVAFAQIKNITFAAGSEGHSFQDIEFEMEEPLPLTIVSGNEDMWDKEWKDGELNLPLQFVYQSDSQTAEIEDSDMNFILTPLFEASDYEGFNTASLSGYGDDGTLNLQFPGPGLYEVSVNVAKGRRYVIDGKKSALVKVANIYPSLDGLKLSYESMDGSGAQKEFALSDDNEIKYQFEIAEGTEDWYHTNSKNPKVSITENDVEIWYRLHGLDDVDDLTPDKTRRVPADPNLNGYSQATEDNSIYVGKLAYAPENTTAELSFILKKNGATTPLLSGSNDGKSEQLITITKATNVETGLDDILTSDEREDSIYTLQGVCLKRDATQSDIDALAPGIYIIGGKKVVVK